MFDDGQPAPNAGGLKITIELLGVEPQVWRAIVAPSHFSFLELHAAIQGAMGWQDMQPHLFELGNRRIGTPEMHEETGEELTIGDCEDGAEIRLQDALSEGSSFFYTYDFQARWHHRLTVEQILPQLKDLGGALCLAGAAACPPEECGGVVGYAEFREALANPDHPQHDNAVAWEPGFAPDVFSVSQANTLMNAMAALYAERGWGFL